jgi:hypothetical protein
MKESLRDWESRGGKKKATKHTGKGWVGKELKMIDFKIYEVFALEWPIQLSNKTFRLTALLLFF